MCLLHPKSLLPNALLQDNLDGDVGVISIKTYINKKKISNLIHIHICQTAHNT